MSAQNQICELTIPVIDVTDEPTFAICEKLGTGFVGGHDVEMRVTSNQRWLEFVVQSSPKRIYRVSLFEIMQNSLRGIRDAMMADISEIEDAAWDQWGDEETKQPDDLVLQVRELCNAEGMT